MAFDLVKNKPKIKSVNKYVGRKKVLDVCAQLPRPSGRGWEEYIMGFSQK